MWVGTVTEVAQLTAYDGIAISISGGKDSQAILEVMHTIIRAQDYSGKVIAVHADTGAEWPQSLPHCRMLCAHYGFDLQVAVPFRALPEHIELRCRKLQAAGIAGGWPSMDCRYCTSDCKRNPIHKVVRAQFPLPEGRKLVRVLSVTGERRQESTGRAKLPVFNTEKALATGFREVVAYRPILDFRVEDVWATIAGTGLPRHVAYDKGNERLSCALCMLAKPGDIRNGARECPELAEHYLRIERETGHTFKNRQTLASILAREEGTENEGT